MRILYRQTLQCPLRPHAEQTLVFKELEARYGDVDGGLFPKYLIPILHVMGDVKGKTILDLGCGSKRSAESSSFFGSGWEPWGCRALQLLGADVIGVDIASNKDETFRWIEADLTQPTSLQEIADQSVDLAYESMLFDSPIFEDVCYKHARQTNTPGFRELVEKRIVSQLERILKPEGIFLHNNPLQADRDAFWR